MNNRIQEIRTTLELSQEELAKVSGVSRTVISQLESGTRKTITFLFPVKNLIYMDYTFFKNQKLCNC